jgi:hypothetical protein
MYPAGGVAARLTSEVVPKMRKPLTALAILADRLELG